MRIFLLSSLDQINTPKKSKLYYWLLLRRQIQFDFIIMGILTQKYTAIQRQRKNRIQMFPQA